MWRKKIVVVTVGAVLTTGMAACSDDSSDSDAKGGGSTSVTIVLSNQQNQSYLPLILADRLGFFKKQGLNAKIESLQGTPQTTNALLQGSAQAMVGFYDHTLDLQAKGKGIESAIQLLQAPGMVEMARADGDVDSPKDMEGKSLGVTSIGSSTSYLGEYLSVHNGVDLKKIHINAVAAGPTFVAAMQHSRIDAGVTTEPTVSTLLKKKIGKIIVDMRTLPGTKAALGGPYPGTAMMVNPSWANSHKDTVQKMVNAMYTSLQWITSHSAKEITAKVPADFYSGPGKEQYTEALANEMGMYNPTGRMPADAPQTVMRVLSSIDPSLKGKKVDVKKTYTDEFVQKAQKTVKTNS